MNERNVGTKIPIGFQQDDLWQELLGKREDPLRDLAEAGISTLEWAIRTDFSETLYLEIARKCRDRGIGVSLHPYSKGDDDPIVFADRPGNTVRETWTRYLRLAEAIGTAQSRPCVVVVHPGSTEFLGKTVFWKTHRAALRRRAVEFLAWLSGFAAEEASATEAVVEIALAADPTGNFLQVGDTYEELIEITSAARALNSRRGTLGFCWDVGHSYMNHARYGLPLEPPDAFLQGVQHVHLHDVVDGADHRPIGTGVVDWQACLDRVESRGFQGDIVLEVGAKGFAEYGGVFPVIERSLHLLRSARTACEKPPMPPIES